MKLHKYIVESIDYNITRPWLLRLWADFTMCKVQAYMPMPT